MWSCTGRKEKFIWLSSMNSTSIQTSNGHHLCHGWFEGGGGWKIVHFPRWMQILSLHLTSSSNSHPCPKLRWVFGMDHIWSLGKVKSNPFHQGSCPPAQFSESLFSTIPRKEKTLLGSSSGEDLVRSRGRTVNTSTQIRSKYVLIREDGQVHTVQRIPSVRPHEGGLSNTLSTHTRVSTSSRGRTVNYESVRTR